MAELSGAKGEQEKTPLYTAIPVFVETCSNFWQGNCGNLAKVLIGEHPRTNGLKYAAGLRNCREGSACLYLHGQN